MKVTINEPLITKLKLVSETTKYTLEETINYMLGIQIAVLALPLKDRETIIAIYEKAFDDN